MLAKNLCCNDDDKIVWGVKAKDFIRVGQGVKAKKGLKLFEY
jgi:hypothetical protein